MRPEFHAELGVISEKNVRLRNHAVLGLLAPEFIPQLIRPDQMDSLPTRRFPVQYIEGRTWWQWRQDRSWGLTEHLAVAREATRQVHWLYQNYGLLLDDRHDWNILVEPSGRVWQCDLELVYDAVQNQSNPINYINLESRPGNWRERDPRRAALLVSDEIRQISKSLSVMARRVRARATSAEKEIIDQINARERFWRQNSAQECNTRLGWSEFLSELNSWL